MSNKQQMPPEYAKLLAVIRRCPGVMPPNDLEHSMSTTPEPEVSSDREEERPDRYAALLSRSRTSAAETLVRQVFGELAHWQQETGKRVRNFRAKSGETYRLAVERFVGDLLRTRGNSESSGRIYHAMGATTFDDVPVNYDVFKGMLTGLVALGLVGFDKGRIAYRKTGERVVLHRRATAFWATDRLVKLAEHFGVQLENIRDHFKLEPPHNPLVLRGPGERLGRKKIKGPIIKYKHDEHTRKLEADIKELNAFLAGCEITGGEHEGYTRNFNNASWKKGGRLYSIGGGYQQMSPPEKRLEMTINGEAVAEIDIKASHLTIYHAKLKAPLSRDRDPYEHVATNRTIAKLWTVASFGNSAPITKWPPEMAKDYKKDTGLELAKVAKAKDVGKNMLEAFPALRKLEQFRGTDIWGDLQFIEAEAVFNTMLILMREHRIPSLSMHDGIIVPQSCVYKTHTILTQQYRKHVGAEPVLTVDPEDCYVDATML